MLRPSLSHQEYVDFVRRRTAKVREPVRHMPAKAKLLLLDLTPAIPILASLYASGGRPAIPPENLLRSLIAVMLCGVTSIDVWVALMRDEPFYAIISGFDPAHVPGVGTFYDFMNRLLNLNPKKVKHLYRPKSKRQQTKKDKQAAKDKNKDTPKHGFLIKTSVCKVAAVGYTERDNQCQLEVADVPQITVTTNECRESRIFYRGPAQPDRSSRQSG